MDPITCCLLGICCPPGSPEQRDAFEVLLAQHFDGDAEKVQAVSDELFEDFAKLTKKLSAAVKKAEKGK